MPTCSMCRKDNDDPIDYGEFMKKSEINVHYYCLLLSTHLAQNGSDFSGILGFLLRDIRNEIKKCEERICIYCKLPYASIACFKCKQYFHNVCANKNACVSEFIDEFRSYCHLHVPFRKDRMLKTAKPTCWICDESLGEYSPIETVRAYCCENGYVHRKCLRKYALNAGYHLICIWCTSKRFRDDVRKHGVFVPDREAVWDNNETLRFTDLHRGYSQCDAKKCICPQGRDFFRATWKLMICCMCGASGVHEKCGQEQISKNLYTCDTCKSILLQAEKSKERRKNTKAAGLNYTMFMSKTYEEAADLLQVVNSQQVDSSDDEASKAQTAKNIPSPPQTPGTSICSEQISQMQPQIREIFVFGKNSQIIGTAQVEQDKIQEKSDKLECKEEDILEFSSSDKLLKLIMSEIVEEGNELPMEEMVDEVFHRFKQSLEMFGG